MVDRELFEENFLRRLDSMEWRILVHDLDDIDEDFRMQLKVNVLLLHTIEFQSFDYFRWHREELLLRLQKYEKSK